MWCAPVSNAGRSWEALETHGLALETPISVPCTLPLLTSTDSRPQGTYLRGVRTGLLYRTGLKFDLYFKI